MLELNRIHCGDNCDLMAELPRACVDLDLEHREWMESALGCNISSMRKFFGDEGSKVTLLSGESDVGLPFSIALVPRYTGQTAFIVASYCVSILTILRAGSFAQVSPAIIRAISVYVVDIGIWPYASHIEKCDAVSRITAAFYANTNVAGIMDTTSNAARFITATLATAINAPNEKPGKRKVIKNREQSRMGDNGNSHEAPQKLIGQRPAVASNGCWPRHYSIAIL